MIEEFKRLDKERRLELLHRLGDEAAGYFRRMLAEALARHRRVVALTHVRPFRDACWHEGRLSNGNGLPHFTCKAAGDAMAEAMRAHPDRESLVPCGHTHGAGEAEVLANLRVWTGGATYGAPVLVLEWG